MSTTPVDVTLVRPVYASGERLAQWLISLACLALAALLVMWAGSLLAPHYSLPYWHAVVGVLAFRFVTHRHYDAIARLRNTGVTK